MTRIPAERVRRVLLGLISLGTDGEPPERANRIRLTNSLTLSTSAAASLFVLQYVFVTPHLAAGALQATFAALHALPLLWTARRRLELARLWVWVFFLLDCFVFSAIVLPSDTGASLFFVLAPVMAHLIYEPERPLPKYLTTLLAIVGYALTMGHEWGTPWVRPDPTDALISNVVTFATCVVGIMLGAHLMTFDRLHTENTLSELAATDHLTGLLNRRAILERGGQRVRDSAGAAPGVAVLMLDIDRFKWLNDRYGHGFGDRVLRRVAGALRASTRGGDLLGRYGGEEFLVILSDTDVSDAMRIAEIIRRTISRHAAEIDGQPIACTASVGVAAGGDDTATLDELIEQADQALYEAKQEGRNRVSLAAEDALAIEEPA